MYDFTKYSCFKLVIKTNQKDTIELTSDNKLKVNMRYFRHLPHPFISAPCPMAPSPKIVASCKVIAKQWNEIVFSFTAIDVLELRRRQLNKIASNCIYSRVFNYYNNVVESLNILKFRHTRILDNT